MKHLSPYLANWKLDGNNYNYKQNRIFYKQQGQGPAILLIHGFPTASWDWHKLWPALNQHFQLLAVDMLGFGFSDKPLFYDYSIHDQADLLTELLRHLQIHQVHILSHDYGDTVAQELLARRQSPSAESKVQCEILSICYLNGGLFPGVHRPRLIQKLLASPIGRFMIPFIGERNLRKTFKNIFGKFSQPTEDELKAFWQLLAYKDGRRVIPLLIRYMAERRKHEQRWTEALQQTTIPMRLINGSADPISGQHLAEHYRKIVPLADVVELADIGHYPQMEAPDQVAAQYQAFIKMHF